MTTALAKCERDGFPILTINGKPHCLAEYVDQCIGGQKIADVIQRAETLYYVFENRHEFPLLCYCCGEPLKCPDLAVERKRLRGRVLQAMTWDTVTLEDGREVIDYELEFSPKSGEATPLLLQTSTQSADAMRHPLSCSRSSLRASNPVVPPVSNPKRRRS